MELSDGRYYLQRVRNLVLLSSWDRSRNWVGLKGHANGNSFELDITATLCGSKDWCADTLRKGLGETTYRGRLAGQKRRVGESIRRPWTFFEKAGCKELKERFISRTACVAEKQEEVPGRQWGKTFSNAFTGCMERQSWGIRWNLA